MNDTNQPHVSIIIPVFNTARYLRACLSSVLIQDCRQLELICVNDGSNDDSMEILQEYRGRYPDLISLVEQNNSGGAKAINVGIEKAIGTYVLILDSDDFLLSGAIDVLLNSALKQKSDLVLGGVVRFKSGEYSKIADMDWLTDDEVLDSDGMRAKLFRHKFYHGKLIARSLLSKNQIKFDEDIVYADGPFVAQLFVNAKRISVLTLPVFAWRKRTLSGDNQSLTQRRAEIAMLEDHVQSLTRALTIVIDSGKPVFVSELVKSDGVRPLRHIKAIYAKYGFSVKIARSVFDILHPYFSCDEVSKIDTHAGFLSRRIVDALITKRFVLFCVYSYLSHRAASR